MDKIIQALEQKIKQLEQHKSDYWRGVRDGYISSLDFIEQLNKPVVMQGLLKQSDVSAAAKKHWQEVYGLYALEEKAQDSFEAGVWWACSKLSSSPTVASEGQEKSVSGGNLCLHQNVIFQDDKPLCVDCGNIP